MPAKPIDRLREICLALPEAHEVEAWGEPTFRVKDKMFAMHARAESHHGGGREGVWCKAKPVTQDMMIRAEPDRYFSPPYMGPKGWVGVWLGRSTDWATLDELLRDAYRMTAPKRLLARMDGAVDETPSEKKAVKTTSKTATKTTRTKKTKTKTTNTARKTARKAPTRAPTKAAKNTARRVRR
jgi:hypothetical protein